MQRALNGFSVDLTAPTTSIGTVTPPAITVSTLFRSANSGNIPFVAQPSGTGALQLQQTDNTATGGNARGVNAIDLQSARNSATEVASGQGAIAVGVSNMSSGLYSMSFGSGNLNTGNWAFAAGQSNNVQGQSVFCGGQTNVALGSWTFIAGLNNRADGLWSSALGSKATTKGISGLFALGIAFFSVEGASQTTITTLAGQTTNNTPRALESNALGVPTISQLVLLNNSALYVEGLVIANVTGGGDTSSWKIAATIKRGANAASTVLVGTPTITLAHQNAGASTWAVSAVTADTTNGCLVVTVTGQAATTIRWTCTLFATEVAF